MPHPRRSSCLRSLTALAIGLAIATLAGPAEAQRVLRPWIDRAASYTAGPYTIRTDVDPATARSLGRHLELMYLEYQRRLASLPKRAPEQLDVLIFAKRTDYLSTLRVRYGVNGQNTGGMFFVNDLGAALAVWIEDLPRQRVEHVLQHEGFHQFAYSRFGNDLPVWLDEGLAELFGAAVMLDGTLVLGQTSPRVLDEVKEAIELDRHIPFRRLLDMTPQQWRRGFADGSASLLYNQSWSMVHFLVYGDGGRYVEAFERYLRLLAHGVTSPIAFAQAFGPEIGPFEERWKVHALNARPSAFVTAMERIEFLAEGALALSREGIIPTTLDELRRELSRVGFTMSLRHHGLDVVLAASDPSLYTIPDDDLGTTRPAFIVGPQNPARLPPRLRHLETLHPSPPLIRTERLEPRGIEVRWIREPGTGPVTAYEIRISRP